MKKSRIAARRTTGLRTSATLRQGSPQSPDRIQVFILFGFVGSLALCGLAALSGVGWMLWLLISH